MSDTENHASLKNGDRRVSKPDSGYRDKPNSHRSDHERLRVRKQDGERKIFYEHHHRDFKNGSFRGRGKYDNYNRHQNRDYHRHQGHVRDGEMRHKYGTQSSYRSKMESRSRSKSPSHSESKRTSGFDMAPPTVAAIPDLLGGNVGLHVLSAYTL